MKTYRRRKKERDNLPGEILTIIFERLPVKFIIRCMCVRKSWYHLIKSPLFVTAHLNYQKTHYCYLLFRSIDFDYPAPPLSLRVDDVQREEYRSLLYPCGLFGSSVCGVANGLICVATSLVGYYSKALLWNPTIRKLKTLPHPPRLSIPRYDRISLAFGFCRKFDDFKVVKIVKYKSCDNKYLFTVADVYSLATNSWKTSKNSLMTIQYVSQEDWLFLNDAAYFRGETVYDREAVIVCYDIDRDILRQISLPQSCGGLEEGNNYSVQAYGESVALFTRTFCRTGFNVWILNENGADVCWEKKFRIDLLRAGLLRTQTTWSILCMRSNGEVLLGNTLERRRVSYNLETTDATDFAWKKQPYCISSFVKSLVLIDT